MPDSRPDPLTSLSGDATLPPEQTAAYPVTSDMLSGYPGLGPAQAAGELGRLSGYRVLKVLGQGGMGVVFQAEDTRLGRGVALKMMLPELAASPEARERFLREARAQAQIEHDHIVAIYQVGEDNGVPFLAMPLLRGMALNAYLQSGKPLMIGHIVRIGRETARGLQAAHERGLIHRDIKPANLWLDSTAGGRVKILDFGLARAQKSDNQLTVSGAIVGTPAYMPPEQIAGKPEPRSDLYSLGVVLYRLLAGRQPFDQADTLALLMAIATEPPPPLRQVAPHVPASLAALVMRLLEKKPADRPASAREVFEALRAIERELASPQGAAALATPPEDVPTLVEPAIRPKRIPPPPLEPTLPAPPRRKPKPGRARPRRQLWPAFLGGGVLVAAVAVVLVFALRIDRRPKQQLTGKGNESATKGSPGAEPRLPPGIRKPPEGFVALFDGKSLDGWRAHADSAGWEPREGVLNYDGTGRGYLGTVKSFGDFELDLEWRIPKGGNSGVFLRLGDFPGNAPRSPAEGLEVQIFDHPSDPRFGANHHCGAIVKLQAPSVSVYRGPDQWQRYQISCRQRRVVVLFEGTEVIDISPQTHPVLEAFRARLPLRGPIGLQNWGTPVAFRNIFIKELPIDQ